MATSTLAVPDSTAHSNLSTVAREKLPPAELGPAVASGPLLLALSGK